MVKITRMKSIIQYYDILKWIIRSQALRIALMRSMGAVHRLNVSGAEEN